jgi:hypothetical protein
VIPYRGKEWRKEFPGAGGEAVPAGRKPKLNWNRSLG